MRKGAPEDLENRVEKVLWADVYRAVITGLYAHDEWNGLEEPLAKSQADAAVKSMREFFSNAPGRGLRTLEEADREALKVFRHGHKFPRPNVRACPKCGQELDDVDGTVMMSHPPKKRIRCPSCGYEGYRIFL